MRGELKAAYSEFVVEGLTPNERLWFAMFLCSTGLLLAPCAERRGMGASARIKSNIYLPRKKIASTAVLVPSGNFDFIKPAL